MYLWTEYVVRRTVCKIHIFGIFLRAYLIELSMDLSTGVHTDNNNVLAFVPRSTIILLMNQTSCLLITAKEAIKFQQDTYTHSLAIFSSHVPKLPIPGCRELLSNMERRDVSDDRGTAVECSNRGLVAVR